MSASTAGPLHFARSSHPGGAPYWIFSGSAGGVHGAPEFFEARPALPLFALVRLRRALSTEGVELAPGARGTIVDRVQRTDAYIVEFAAPALCVATVRAPDLEVRPA